jgi:CRISPR-associated protein Cas5/CasD subtype I-E
MTDQSRGIVLILSSTMQSWGSDSKVAIRGSEDFPTLSAVIGLVRNALGAEEDRENWLSDATLSSRRDVSGSTLIDFHTIENALLSRNGSISTDPVTTMRSYLISTTFVSVLRFPGHDDMVDKVAQALQNPARPIYLGRRKCSLALPVFLGIVGEDTDDHTVLAEIPVYGVQNPAERSVTNSDCVQINYDPRATQKEFHHFQRRTTSDVPLWSKHNAGPMERSWGARTSHIVNMSPSDRLGFGPFAWKQLEKAVSELGS